MWWWWFKCVWLFATPWSVACQAPLSTGFPRQEYWSRLPFPPAVDLPYLGIELPFPTWQADFLPLSHLESPKEDIDANKHVGCSTSNVIMMCYAELLSRVWLLWTLWAIVCQAPLSMGFSRIEYWSLLPCLPQEEISSISHSVAFLYFFALIT